MQQTSPISLPRSPIRLVLAFCAILSPSIAHAGPLLLELFTSQSCSSCPPADELLNELAHHPGVLVLDMHVDYWNGTGWRDPYSLAAVTERQTLYASQLRQTEIYTPELVVGGRVGVAGSDRAAVAASIATVQQLGAPSVTLQLHRAGPAIEASVGGGTGTGTLWLVGYDASHISRIGGGENTGRTLTETNVVRSLSPVAQWAGTALRYASALPQGERVAAFLQAPDGHIIAAASLAAPGEESPSPK